MAQRIDKKTEEKLVEALEKVCQMTSTTGADPNEAMASVVREYKIRPGHIQLMVQAYNNGRTNSHLKSAEELDDKASSFPLANAQAVIDLVYPSLVVKKADQIRETSVSSDYLRSPDHWTEDLFRRERIKSCLKPVTVKKASTTLLSDPMKKDRLVVEALSEIKRAEKEGEAKRLAVFAAQEKLAQSIRDLDDYFKRVDALPMTVVMTHVRAYCGRDGEMILRKVVQPPIRGHGKTASSSPANWSKEPYSTVLQGVRHLREYARAKEDYETFCRRAFPKVAELHASLTGSVSVKNGSVLDGIVPWREKIARAPATVPSTRELLRWRHSLGTHPMQVRNRTVQSRSEMTIKKSAEESLSDADSGDDYSLKKLLKSTANLPPQQAAVASFSKKLDNPKYLSEASAAWIRYLLYDMMATDPVLSGFSADELTSAYNEIAMLAPRAVNQPALLRQLLRRYLSQGALDTHDLNQLVQIERKLQQISSSDVRSSD